MIVLPGGARRGDAAQPLRDLRRVQGLAADLIHVGGRFVIGQQLNRADAIPAQPGQQVEGVGAGGLVALGQAAADGVVLGQEIVEIVGDERPLVGRIAGQEGQRKRDGARLLIHQPVVEIAETLALPGAFPVADRDAVDPDGQALRM